MPSSDRSPKSSETFAPWCLARRSDQAAVAILLVVALIAIAGWWSWQGGAGGWLVEVDQTETLDAAFEVDVNTAEWPELAQLPGIGETLAQRIVQSRQTEGPFHRVDELSRVRGIGSKLLERIRPFLRVEETGDRAR